VPTNLTIPFGADISRDLLVGVQSITSGNVQLSSSTTAFYAMIDSTVPYLYLPESVCTAFEKEFGLVYDEYYDLYLVNDTLHDSLKAQNKSITLTLGESTAGGQTVNITLPYAAMDLQISYPYVANTSRYYPLKRGANSTQYTLGRAFLQEAYVAADYERRNFTVAPCAWQQNAPADIRTIFSPDSKYSFNNGNSEGISDGAIAGIVIGVLAIIALLAAALWFMHRKKQQKKYAAVELDAKSLAATQTPSGPSSPSKEDARHIGGGSDGVSTPIGGELDSSGQIHEVAGTSKANATEMDAPWRGELDAGAGGGGLREFYGKLPQNTFEMEGNNEPIFEMDATATQLHELEPDTRRQSWDQGDDRGDEKRYLQMQGY
jgi:hypothetical protein